MDAPYFPFYPADWLSDPNVQFLSLEESGAYITLLAYMWRDGKECSLPDDDKYLSRLLHVSKQKWRKLREVLIDGEHAVLKKSSDSQIRNKRLDKEWSHMVENRVKRSAAAKTRWDNDKSQDANAMQVHDENDACASNVHMQNDAISESESDPYSDTDPKIKDSTTTRTSHTTDIYAEIEGHMQTKMVNPNYKLVGNDYNAAKVLLEEQIPLEFIILGTDEAFANYKPKGKLDRIRNFAYCAPRIEQNWHEQQTVKQAAVSIEIRTQSRAAPKHLHSEGEKGSTANGQKDERYSAFYQLFPDG